MNRSASISSVVILLLSIGVAHPALAQKARAPRQIHVTSNDYTFVAFPNQISTGPTIFTFANQGKVFHELSLARLKPGATMEDFVKAREDPARRRELIDRSVGILIAGPGSTPDGRLLVDLMRGTTYVVFCNFRDKAGRAGAPMFGMYTSFTPK